MKFVHIADVHLGAAPDSEMPWGEKRKQDIKNTFYGLLKRVKAEGIPLLLIAGDLFHGQPLKRELKELNQCFADMKDTQIVCIAGNHDYVHPKSYYRGFPWAENVHFLLHKELQSVYLDNLRVTVYGSSYWGSRETEDVYSDCRPNGRDGYHILLAHGGDAQHRPFSAERLKGAGFDYVACGHIHRAGHIVQDKIVMAGALEPTDRNDLGPHGYWEGELDGKICRSIFHPVKNCQYVDTEIPVDERMGMYQIKEQVLRILRDREPYEISHLHFTGYTDPELRIDTGAFLQSERVVAVKDETKPAYDFAHLKKQYADGLIGRFIEKMEQYPQRELAQRALYYGMDAIYRSREE